jgi:amicyanin
MMNHLRLTAKRLSPPRVVIVAMLLGPVFGAMIAFRTVAAEGANEIKIDNFTFSPPELTVAVGTTVTWVNHDDMPHSIVDKNKAFRSKTLDTNNSFSFTFANAGTYDYFCGLHPHMTAKIIVK